MPRALPLLAVFLLALGFPAPRGVRAEDGEAKLGTAITALPYTISSPGVYVLHSDLAYSFDSGSAVQVTASNVVINLNGHTISNLAAGAGTAASGVYANGQSNVTVRNGTLAGFCVGVTLTTADPASYGGHLLDGLSLDRNTCYGVYLFGATSTVRDCQVNATGGSTAYASIPTTAISVTGPGARVLDNDVFGVRPAVGAPVPPEFPVCGIYAESEDAMLVNNRISGVPETNGVGAYLPNWTGKYRGNDVSMAGSVGTGTGGGGGASASSYTGGQSSGHNSGGTGPDGGGAGPGGGGGATVGAPEDESESITYYPAVTEPVLDPVLLPAPWFSDVRALPIDPEDPSKGLDPTKIELSWFAFSTDGLIGFIIERRGEDGKWEDLDQVAADVDSYTDEALKANVLYKYRISALNGNGRSVVPVWGEISYYTPVLTDLFTESGWISNTKLGVSGPDPAAPNKRYLTLEITNTAWTDKEVTDTYVHESFYNFGTWESKVSYFPRSRKMVDTYTVTTSASTHSYNGDLVEDSVYVKSDEQIVHGLNDPKNIRKASITIFPSHKYSATNGIVWIIDETEEGHKSLNYEAEYKGPLFTNYRWNRGDSEFESKQEKQEIFHGYEEFSDKFHAESTVAPDGLWSGTWTHINGSWLDPEETIKIDPPLTTSSGELDNAWDKYISGGLHDQTPLRESLNDLRENRPAFSLIPTVKPNGETIVNTATSISVTKSVPGSGPNHDASFLQKTWNFADEYTTADFIEDTLAELPNYYHPEVNQPSNWEHANSRFLVEDTDPRYGLKGAYGNAGCFYGGVVTGNKLFYNSSMYEWGPYWRRWCSNRLDLDRAYLDAGWTLSETETWLSVKRTRYRFKTFASVPSTMRWLEVFWPWELSDPRIIDGPAGKTVQLVRSRSAELGSDLPAQTGFYEINPAALPESQRGGGAYALIPIPVQLHIDSDNNDGFDQPSATPDEERVQNMTGKPGKVLVVSDGDLDQNGVPDFADGLRLYDNDNGEVPTLVPLKLSVFWANSQATVKFTYPASDPAQVQRTGSVEAGYTYRLPSEGRLRLWHPHEYWQPPGRAVTDVAHGGAFIQSGVEYTLDQLKSYADSADTITLLVEAVRPSVQMGEEIKVELNYQGRVTESFAPYLTDTVRVTAVSTRLVTVPDRASNDTLPAQAIAPSHPSPFIGSQFSVSAVHASSDGSAILANIGVQGSLSSAVCDYTAGEAGTIRTVELYLNGARTPLAIIDASNVQKGSNPDSLVRPFPFSATYFGVLHDVRLRAGVNTFRIVARDPVYGLSGFNEWSVEITPNYRGLANPPPAPRPFLPPLGRAAAAAGTQRGAAAGSAQGTGSVVYGNFDDEDEYARSWLDYDFAAGEPQGTGYSNGGEFYPYLMELEGPAELLAQIKEVATADGPRAVIKGPGTKYYLRMKNDAAPAVLIARQLEARNAEMLPMYLDTAVTVVGNYYRFQYGIIHGFLGGGVNLVEGIFSLAKLAVTEYNKFTNPMAFAFEMTFGGRFANEQRFAVGTYKTAISVAQIAWALGNTVLEDEIDFFVSLLTWNLDEASMLSEPYLAMLSVCAEFLTQIAKSKLIEFKDDPEAAGQFIGRAAFEVLALVAPYAKAGLLAKLGDFNILNELRNVRFFQQNAQAAAALAEFFQQNAAWLARLQPGTALTTKMCFVAGTPVHTLTGLRPIEQVRAGDRVLSRDPHDGRQAYKRVLQTFVTHPTRLHRITYRRSRQSGVRGVASVTRRADANALRDDGSGEGDEGGDGDDGNKDEELTCTATHPFFVVERGGFISAEHLQASEHLSLADGQTAEVAGNELVKLDPKSAGLTTYNFEVEDFHTYFVGHAGAWVHNVGAHCESLFRLYTHFRRLPNAAGETPYQTLVRVRTTLASKPGVSKYASVFWRKSCTEVCNEMFSDFQNGRRALGDLPSYLDIKRDFCPGLGGHEEWFPAISRVDVHHVVEKWIQKRLGIPATDLVPGAAIPKHSGMFGHAQLAGRLSSEIRSLRLTGMTQLQQRQEIINALFKVYKEQNEWQLMAPVAKAWLKQYPQMSGVTFPAWVVP